MQLLLAFKALLMLFLLHPSPEAAARTKKVCRSSRRSRDTPRVRFNTNLNISTFYSPSPNRSLSPWRYETSEDESRIPMVISEARCERKGCLMGGDEVLDLESKPIYYEINILKKVKNKRSYSLKLEKKTISVGCTCVLPIIAPQTP